LTFTAEANVCHNVIKTLLEKEQSVELLTFDFNADKYQDNVGEGFPKQVTIHSLGKRIEVEPPFTIYKEAPKPCQSKQYKGKLEYDYLFSTILFSIRACFPEQS
jgi:hypothetical protein